MRCHLDDVQALESAVHIPHWDIFISLRRTFDDETFLRLTISQLLIWSNDKLLKSFSLVYKYFQFGPQMAEIKVGGRFQFQSPIEVWHFAHPHGGPTSSPIVLFIYLIHAWSNPHQTKLKGVSPRRDERLKCECKWIVSTLASPILAQTVKATTVLLIMRRSLNTDERRLMSYI